MPRNFVDDLARSHSPYTQAVYMALCCHSDDKGFSFWGCRRIAEVLGINKSTVAASIREIIASGLAVRSYDERRRVAGVTIKDVRFEKVQVYEESVPKKVFKEDIKKVEPPLTKNQLTERYRGMYEKIRETSSKEAAAFAEKYGLGTD